MFNYSVRADAGPSIPTIIMSLWNGNFLLAKAVLVPHSTELYEIHISHIDYSIKGKMDLIAKEGFRFLFNDMAKVQKIVAFIPVHNRLAIKLANKCMNHEGTLKNSFLYEGSMEDQMIFGINREAV